MGLPFKGILTAHGCPTPLANRRTRRLKLSKLGGSLRSKQTGGNHFGLGGLVPRQMAPQVSLPAYRLAARLVLHWANIVAVTTLGPPRLLSCPSTRLVLIRQVGGRAVVKLDNLFVHCHASRTRVRAIPTATQPRRRGRGNRCRRWC